MKRSFLLSGLVFIVLVSCQKRGFEDFVIPRNPVVTIHGKNGIDARATDIYSRLTEMKRKIELINTYSGKILGEVFITLTSSNKKESIYHKIRTDASHFSGELMIEAGGQIVFSKRIVNGVPLTAVAYHKKVPGPVYNPGLSCTVSTIHNCVAYEVDDMNWVQYSLCLMAAPGCYLKTWLNCQWEVCHNHMEYTNPN